MPKAERVDIEVRSPVEKVYGYWRTLENLPNFMGNVEEVRSVGDRRTHWRVKGPLGSRLEFDAETTQEQENRVIAWEPLEGDVGTSGEVRFRELGPDRTRVEVTMSYADPPGGRLGEVGARLVANPRAAVDRGLRNFKEIMEGRATPEETRRAAPRSGASAGGRGEEGLPNLGAIALLDEWEADESGYDEEVLPELKESLDRDRPGYRKLFG